MAARPYLLASLVSVCLSCHSGHEPIGPSEVFVHFWGQVGPSTLYVEVDEREARTSLAVYVGDREGSGSPTPDEPSQPRVTDPVEAEADLLGVRRQLSPEERERWITLLTDPRHLRNAYRDDSRADACGEFDRRGYGVIVGIGAVPEEFSRRTVVSGVCLSRAWSRHESSLELIDEIERLALDLGAPLDALDHDLGGPKHEHPPEGEAW